MSKRYVIGIDLGTTNCGVAYVEPSQAADALHLPPVELQPVVQLVNPGEVAAQNLLPSALYLPDELDFPQGSIQLPWEQQPDFVVGVLAQRRGVERTNRLVTSAKSWLCHSGVDRTAPILPLNAPDGARKVSPVEASSRYLEHIRKSWDYTHPDAPFLEQQVLVTVPASFDAVARELTLRAAEQAGYPAVTLLEEPQAAFYAWLERHPGWRECVHVGDLILVVDIGGGTTDFTLIAVCEEGGELSLERVAVGEHILLGGDNMDLALARFVEQQLAAKNTKLDAVQFHALWQQCRLAKEKLLAHSNQASEHPITLLGRGTGLVGGAIRTKLAREDLERIVLDGFFPKVSSDEMPAKQRRLALQEVGLPYASDAAITRHLARFLRQPAASVEPGAIRRTRSGLAAPTHILLNGGVLSAQPVRSRLLEVVNCWLDQEGMPAAQILAGEDLLHAVARGAAYYGMARRGQGIRIRGGVPRTYYVGIETAMPAVPGMPAPIKALTVVPFGMEEGSSHQLAGREFGLIVGEPAEFRFFCSSTRKNDPVGSLLEEWDPEELEELAPMDVTLSADGVTGDTVRVTLESTVTETGLLQLWCVAKDGRRWKLEFNVRERVA
ncbi:MAG: Hsp70 family protein [Bryobacteraceae bacterium]|nr:Hsp70 family protein [Bryobacteraceae bacterium]MDW8378651.1 Hsp70 family protein [Bryobacterales bacterium]